MSRARELSSLCHRSECADPFRRVRFVSQNIRLRAHVALCGRRVGGARLKFVIVAALLVVGAGVGVWKFAPASWQGPAVAPLTGEVIVDKFVHELVERGDIKSSANVEVRSEVQLRGNSNGGIAILQIVPEGTFVEEGDFLVRLDSSNLETDLTLQEIDVNSSQANVIQTQTGVETCKLALSEYESGTFKQQEEQMQSEVFVAEENYRRAQEYVRYSERLASKGYVTPIQLEADRFAVEKAQKELDVSRTKLEVLRHFTKQKMMKQLEADVKTAEAKLNAALEIHSVEVAHLNRVKEQISKCVIVAPKAGQVVYANDQAFGQSADGILIEEGRYVRERQVIIRLPNPKQMQVVAKVNESRIDLVRPGMRAKVKVDALPDVELVGEVRKVSEYPTQQASAFTSHIKEYATEIAIIDPPEGLRPGMTAQASIIAEERDKATQVPLQAVMERNGRYYVLVQTPAGLEPKQVQVGPTNEKFVVVESGLVGGEQVVMTPKQYVDDLTLPEPIDFPSRKQLMLASKKKANVSEASSQIAHSELTTRPAKREPIKRSKASLNESHGAGL
ncbi:MAG: efflux transporter periplasmic adaptor subunit [Pirellula sp.]|nr:efflux transporter periplasmic adaptor subunit [Pirellula sp.]